MVSQYQWYRQSKMYQDWRRVATATTASVTALRSLARTAATTASTSNCTHWAEVLKRERESDRCPPRLVPHSILKSQSGLLSQLPKKKAITKTQHRITLRDWGGLDNTHSLSPSVPVPVLRSHRGAQSLNRQSRHEGFRSPARFHPYGFQRR